MKGLWGRRIGLWRRKRESHPVEHFDPRYGDRCGVLRSQQAVLDAKLALEQANLPLHPDDPKNWDALHALATILKRTTPEARVLDAGSGTYGPILFWLAILGYKELIGCDLAFKKDFHVGPILYRKASLLETRYPDNHFDAITCLSVVEHGVDLRAYAREMRRLLKPGGVLITSTDYWPTPIDTKGIYPYGREMGEMKIFDKPALQAFIDELTRNGLRPVKTMEYLAEERVVHWERTGKKYTFAIVTCVKTPVAGPEVTPRRLRVP